jgi:hypothetical protein
MISQQGPLLHVWFLGFSAIDLSACLPAMVLTSAPFETNFIVFAELGYSYCARSTTTTLAEALQAKQREYSSHGGSSSQSTQSKAAARGQQVAAMLCSALPCKAYPQNTV